MRLQGRENEPAPLYDWQISAFDGLTGADQAIYNSLYTVKDEIPVIYDDINRFNEPGVKFRWPNLQDFEDWLLPPFSSRYELGAERFAAVVAARAVGRRRDARLDDVSRHRRP